MSARSSTSGRSGKVELQIQPTIGAKRVTRAGETKYNIRTAHKMEQNMPRKNRFANQASLVERAIRAGILFVYDPASGKIIAGNSIASVHPTKGGGIQIDLAENWWTEFPRFMGGIGACNPANACEDDGDDHDVRERVAQMRELAAAGQIEILDPTSGFVIPSDLIEDISANGQAVQLTLDRMWHDYRQERLRCSVDTDDSVPTTGTED